MFGNRKQISDNSITKAAIVMLLHFKIDKNHTSVSHYYVLMSVAY